MAAAHGLLELAEEAVKRRGNRYFSIHALSK
jgi:hypothetical protein